MTSRRPMARSFSSNGRTSSFSDEDSSSSNGRNTYLSNVRPENRSTLCSVMAQLTEDIQPSFETTLKSKAVSENCNVKFTCVVSGYPAPELKWYKDDMEMDRYCGLPKYEIRRNGKNHSLHIYNCTLDDAAIYQVSACNSKGIVSCSGVLEVGTMNEYKIHQRFFAKLKQKAEKRRNELDEPPKTEDKENIKTEMPQRSPEPPPRKRANPVPQERPVVKEQTPSEQLGAAAEPNGVSSDVVAPVTSKDLEKEISPPVETSAKKKIKMSNGVDAGPNSSSNSSSANINSRSHMMGNGGENCYDGGISLAQFLSETLQSQGSEKPKEVNISTVNDSKEKEGMQKEREEKETTLKDEYEREKKREETIEIEKERERPSEMSHTAAHNKHGPEVKHHSKTHKDPDHHNIQASLSSMLHTVKDFLFGKSKKESHDQTEREFDHDSIQPRQPETPPSFRLRQEYPEVTVVEDVVPMETDQPKDTSESVEIEQKSLSSETREHRHEDAVLRSDLPSAHKLPTEGAEEQIVKVTEDVVEAMEMSVEAANTSPHEEKLLSGLQVLTQMENKDCQVVTVQPHVKQQEPECMTVSPQLNLQASRGESSPWGDISALPQTKTPYEEECPPTSTLTNLEDSRTPPHSAISVSNSHSLEQAPTEMVREEQLTIDKISNRGKPVTEERHSSIKLCEEEKAEVKSSKQPCSDINRSEITEFTTYSLEERIEPRESKTPDQVVLPQSALVAHAPESDYVKEGTECVSVVQEMNVGFPPTEASVSFKKVDLKKQQECTPIIEEESAEVPNISTIHSSDSGFRSNKERSDPKEVLNSAVEEDLEVNLCNSSNAQERAIIESSEVRNEGLLFEVKKEACVEETKILSVTQNEGSNENVLEEQSQIAHQEGGERQFSWPSDNIPQIQISSIEDTIDITLTVPDVKQHEHFEIPKNEIMEPEVKESTLPLTVLALNKTESEPLVLQKNETAHASEITLQDQGMTDLPHLLATQKGIQNDNNFSPTEILKEVAQLDDKTKMLEMQRPQVKSSEQLPQMDYASIPVISVSCTDDTGSDSSVKANVSHDKVPLFVVPPISVTCHESESGSSLPTLSEWTETETLAATQRGTEPVGDSIVAPDLEKTQSTKQNLEEVIEKSLKENTPPLPCETLLPKVVASLPSLNKPTEDNGAIEILKIKPHKEAKVENSMLFEDLQRNRSSVERLSCKPPAHPSLSPGSLRKFMSKAAPDSDNVGDKVDEDGSGGSTPTSSLSCESSPRMKRRDSLTLIRSATPEELASGARRKIFIPKAIDDAQGAAVDAQVKKENPYMSPSQARRAALLQAPTGQNTPPMERRSPLLSRRKATLEVPKVVEEIPKEEPVTKKEEKPAEKKPDPLKAPQVIRKIRGEPFPDASGHLKLWCQFFNVLSDSTIKWFRDEEEILAVNKSGGDESQVALAIVLASSHDCGVYGCTISNEHGSDTTDFLLSVDILSEILLRDDLEVGEEIEMTPLLFTKGLADCGSWGDKYFGRIMTEMLHMGEGCAHKASRVRVIYGLDPVFDSGTNCIIKVQNPIAYGTKQDNSLAERNLVVTKQECKVQNTIREYCKIFAAEARVIENFGFSLEVIPQYLMYRPANTVPYATVEADLDGVFLKYCMMDPKGRLITRTTSEVEQKCSTFQHWIHQWTHGNLLVTRLEGVETKLTNVRVVTKSKGYQGLTERASPEVFEQFITHHQCNYYCGLLSLRPLKSMDSLQQPTKMKGSRSPLLNRKLGSNSPQLQRKGHSPQLSRKATSSPKVTRKAPEAEDNKLDVKPMPAVTSDGVEIR